MRFFRRIFQRLIPSSPLVLLTLMAGVFAAYMPALNGQFLWDDSYLVGSNPLFRSPVFCLEVFRHYLFLDSPSSYYRPVQNLSYILDYWIWRDNPFGYHFSNLLLQGGSAFLLFLLLKRILPGLVDPESRGEREASSLATAIAFCVALLWAIHPIHNAVVAYVAGRADSLIAFFALAGWLLFLESGNCPPWSRWGLRAGAFFSALLALCSKEVGLVWIFVFCVWAVCFTRGLAGKASSESSRQRGIPFSNRLGLFGTVMLLIAVYAWLHQLPGRPLAKDLSPSEPFEGRLILMFKAMGEYTGLLFWPAHLHMERSLGIPAPLLDLSAWRGCIASDYKAILGLLALSILGWGCWRQGPGRKLRLFGTIWFLAGFLPISNLIPLNAQAAEHWIYMPSIGFLLVLAGFALALPIGARGIAIWLSLLASIPLVIRTAYRSQEWVDPEKFFAQTLEAGGNSQRIKLNRDTAASWKGNLAEAEQRLRQRLRESPNLPSFRLNLAILLLEQKDPSKISEAEALLTFDRASLERTAYPKAWIAALHLARVRIAQQRVDAALAILDEAIGLYPRIWELVAYKAQILKQFRSPATAIPEVQKYLDAHWWHFSACMLLGDLRAANGEMDAAMRLWRNAAKLDIHNAEPFLRIARYAAARGQQSIAEEARKKAIERDRESSSILDQLHR